MRIETGHLGKNTQRLTYPIGQSNQTFKTAIDLNACSGILILMDNTAQHPIRQVSNPPNPWHSHAMEYLGPPPKTQLELYEDHSRSILTRNDSPDVPFTFSVNPYRGCYHGCSYCYARNGHSYLDFGTGTDFDRKILYKPEAAALLRKAFDKPSWQGDQVVFSGVTDCYQPIEASLEKTRECLMVCREYRNPVGIITRSALIERDIPILQDLASIGACSVVLSIPFDDPQHARAIEPHAPTPARRFRTIERLHEAGIPVGVNVAPIIPGLNDQAIPTILKKAREAGASHAGMILLRLPGQVHDVFLARLKHAFPDRAARVMNQLALCRGGQKNDSRFGHRMRGNGPRWEIIKTMYETWTQRLGYGDSPATPSPSPFRRPGPEQITLF